MTYKEMEDFFGISHKVIQKRIDFLGLPKPRNPRFLDKKTLESVLSLYQEGFSTKSIAEKQRIPYQKVCSAIKRSGLMRSAYDQIYKIHKIKDDFFEKIDCEEKAYFVGFIYADGYLYKRSNRLSISLQNRDIYILERLRKLLKSDVPINPEANKNCSRINFYNKKMYEDLEHKGLHQNKSFTIQFPSSDIIPNHLMRHFIRGYFDGDGSVCTYKQSAYNSLRGYYSFVGNENFIKDLDAFLSLHIFGHRTLSSKSNCPRCFNISCGSKRGIKEFYDFIYHESSIFLTRKKEKFENYFLTKSLETDTRNRQC